MTWFNRFIVHIIMVIVLFSASNIQWGGNHWKNIIEVDGKGYYAYLPAIFIYKDLNFSFFDSIEQVHPNPSIYYDYRATCKGGICNKYFVGTSLAMAPFFLVAHSIATFIGHENDGYSKVYLIAINIAAIFYLWLGLFYLKKLLLKYTTQESLVSFILILIVFSTNLFFYAVREPSMSHVYSFAFITCFVFYSKKYFELPSVKLIFVISCLLGIIVLIRPVNGIVLFSLPFIANDFKKLKEGVFFFLKKYWLVFISSAVFLSIVSIQFVIYKIQTGYFFIDSYGSETFNWFGSHPVDFLMSYKKGFFIYTPVMLVSLFGFKFLYKNNRFEFYCLSSFLLILIYVLSSWWNWWYGGSFGTRVMIEYYCFFAILLLFTMQAIKTRIQTIVLSSALILTIFICQIQMYQYRYYHIHWENMDKEHYWRNFLRIDLIGKGINLNKDLLENKL